MRRKLPNRRRAVRFRRSAGWPPPRRLSRRERSHLLSARTRGASRGVFEGGALWVFVGFFSLLAGFPGRASALRLLLLYRVDRSPRQRRWRQKRACTPPPWRRRCRPHCRLAAEYRWRRPGQAPPTGPRDLLDRGRPPYVLSAEALHSYLPYPFPEPFRAGSFNS